jgi:hypothetical protein
MTPNTRAIPGVLVCFATRADDGFAVANGREKLSRHGFPFSMLSAELLE